jgi:hypothetical protein
MAELSDQLWCILVDHDFTRVLGDVFLVDMSPSGFVVNLKKKIRLEKPSILQLLDPDTLTVWRCPGLKLPAIDENGNEIMARINISRKEAQIYPGSIQVSSLSMPPDEMLLVQMPGSYSLSIPVFK